MSDAPSRPVRTNVSRAAHSDGAPPDVSRHSSLSVPPPPRVTICRAGTHRRPWKRSLSNGSFQLHHGRHRRPPWRFAPIRLGTPAADWRLGTSRGCSAHVALTPRKLPPALDAPTQGRASILVVRYSVTAPPWGCAVLPVCGYLQQALRVQEKRRTLVPGGTGVPWRAVWWLRAPTPPAGRYAPVLVERSFTDRAVCCRVASRASSPAQAASGPAGEAGGRAALPCVPWQPLAAAGCCGVFLPPQEAQGNPGGATSRASLSALGAHAHP
jgi:hypothetical protein